MVEGCNKTDRRAGYCVTHGADKKCVVAECSKTGRIDNMCTKHYFERNQPFKGTGESSHAAAFDDSAASGNAGDATSSTGAASATKARKKAPASATLAASGAAGRGRDDLLRTGTKPSNEYRGATSSGAGRGGAGLKSAVAAIDLSKTQQLPPHF